MLWIDVAMSRVLSPLRGVGWPAGLSIWCFLLFGCDDDDAHQPPPPEEYIDNEAACFGDGGLPECRRNETLVCGYIREGRLYESNDESLLSPPIVRRASALGKFLSLETAADVAFSGGISFLVQPDGNAWCLSYYPQAFDAVQLIAQCIHAPPGSRIEILDDNRIAFHVDGVVLLEEQERWSACEYEPVDGSLKGCANIAGLGALLRQ
jgi:hypothetical protein